MRFSLLTCDRAYNSGVRVGEGCRGVRITIGQVPLFSGNENIAIFSRWCKKQKDNGRTLIEILGIAVYQIRFPLMTSVEFDLIKKMGLLQPGEIEDLTSNFRNNKTYKTVPRRNKCACQTNKVNCPLCSVSGCF